MKLLLQIVVLLMMLWLMEIRELNREGIRPVAKSIHSMATTIQEHI